MNNLTHVDRQTLPFDAPSEIESWKLTGAFFFGSVSKLSELSDPKRLTAPNSAKVVILDFSGVLSLDNSVMDVIEVFRRALKRRGHELIIAGAEGHPRRQLRRMGLVDSLGANLVPDMEFALKRARDLLSEMDNKAAAS